MHRTVLHLTNYFPGYHSHVGGAEQATSKLIQCLSEMGYRNVIATTPFDVSPSLSNNMRQTVVELKIMEAFVFRQLAKYLEVLKWYSLQYDPLVPRQLERLHCRHGFSVLCAFNAQFLTASAYSWAKKRGIPIIQFVYDYWLFCPLTTLMHPTGPCRREHGVNCLACLPAYLRPIQAVFLFLRSHVFKRIRNLIDWYVVLSEASKQLLVDFGIQADRIQVIPVFLNQDEFKVYDGPIDESRLFFAGWLQQRKGLDLLIRAMPKIIEQIPEVRLDIFAMPVKWEAEYERKIQGLISALGLGARVKLCKERANEKFHEAWNSCGVVVIPEQWENMSPLLLLESQMKGKCVVASRIGGIPEFVCEGESGFLFRYDDPEDLAAAVVRALRGGIRQQNLAKLAGPKLMRRLSEKKVIQEKLAVMLKSLD